MVRNDLILYSDNFHIIYIRKLTLVKIPQVVHALTSGKYHLTIYISWSDDFHTIRDFMEIFFLQQVLIIMWPFTSAPFAELQVVLFLNSTLIKKEATWFSWRSLSYEKMFLNTTFEYLISSIIEGVGHIVDFWSFSKVIVIVDLL